MPEARTFAVLAVAATLTACAPDPVPRGKPAPPVGVGIALFDAALVADHQWTHKLVRGRTDYRIVHIDGRLAMRAEGRVTASGLMRRIFLDTEACPALRWDWRVDRLQKRADLTRKQGDDVAASLFLLFGDPGFAASPDKVPTLRYVWTGGAHAVGAVIDNPYMPGVVKSVIIRNGTAPLGTWLAETRDIRRDFETAFGHPPKERVHALVLFTDNDQTKEPVTAYYGRVDASCNAMRPLRVQ